MSETRFNVRIYKNDRLAFSTEFSGPVELGRQQTWEMGSAMKYVLPESGVARVVVTPIDDINVSRRHVLIEPLPTGRLKLTNVSANLPVGLSDKSIVAPGAAREIDVPNRLLLGTQVVGIEALEAALPSDEDIEAFGDPLQPPGKTPLDTDAIRRAAMPPGKPVDTEAMLRWLQATVVVAQSAATSKDFLHQVARAVVEIGLDSGAVLMRADGGWSARAFYTEVMTLGGIRWKPSDRVLDAVCEKRSTVWRKPEVSSSGSDSYANLDSVVAAPILDREGLVIGVVYGDRRPGSSRSGAVTRVEAMLVELLACSVSAGLARLDQEQAALAARVRFAQFFSTELSSELEAHPDLLSGKDVEVSILVVDICGFSRVSERLGPAKTVEWIREMMSVLSDCVISHDGVLVDYVGDQIMAMWGAPKDQPDHAVRACRAALDMLRALPRLNEVWKGVLGGAVEIGVGVNTGLARVGNVGSERKFKYGPLGNTVNMASRVQGATRYLKLPLVVTGATQGRLGGEFLARRLCRARVVNIGEPVDLYEVAPADRPDFQGVQSIYEAALQKFEAGQFEEAARLVGQILALRASDGPSLVLMSRILDCLIEGPDRFDAVWTLPGK